MREPPKCRECKRLINFVTTKAGRQMPVDSFSVRVMPYVRGSVFYMENGEQIKGYEVEPGTPKAVKAYVPHWTTCPYADELRRKKPDKRRENIRVQVEREREKEERRQEKKTIADATMEIETAQISIFGLSV